MAELYIHIPGGEQLSIVPEASSSQDWALMGDNKLSFSFQRYECLILPAGAWCEFDGVVFYLLQEYKPTMIHSHLWQYNVAFVDGASWLGVTTALKTIDGEDAPLFTLTAPAAEHAAIIVSNLNRRLGTTMWKVGSVIDTPNITIEYTGKYCGAVLQEIVDDQNTEWWVDGTTLNIGRAEFGSLIELGYRDGLLGDITVTQADNMSSYRTLYPVGSTRNILPTEYGHDRLQLPNGQKSVMMNPAGVAELVEEAAFAGIYPRYKGKVTGVSTSIGQSNDGSQYLIYIVADTAIPFNPNEYEMPGLVKRITFQSGELMGAEFEVNYNPASNEFELITQFQENGSQLPGGMLIPQVGDEYVVWNISMPAEYYPLAEQELLEAAESFAAAATRESNVYKVKLDYIDIQERGLSLRPGQKVRLHSLDYFPEQGYYDSRITRVTRPVNYPGEYTIDVSAVRVVGSLAQLQTSLAAATTKVNSLSNTVQTVVQTVSNAVTLTGNQRVQGVKNFVDGIRLNGSPIIEYHPTINTWLFRGNILAEGGMAAFSNISGFKPSTITDAVLIDDRTIKRNADGLLYAVDQGAGGINEDQLADYLTTNGYATQDWVTDKGYITGITGTMVTNALGYTPYNSVNFTKANIKSALGISDWALASAKPTYTASEVGALAQDSSSTSADLDTILGSKTAVLKPFFQAITGTNIGSARKGVLRMSYNGSESQLLFDHYNRLLRYRTIGANPKDWATIAFTSDIPTSLKNPTSLSWSGYSSGSYDGSTAQNIALPTKLSQLTDDVVSGKYLSLAGGTVNGQITSKGYDNYIAQGDTYTLIFGIGSGQVNRGIFDLTNNSWLLYRDATTNILIPTGNLAIGGIMASEKLHVYGNILATGGITAPTFTGVASHATYWNASAVRPSSANIAVTGKTTLSHFLATGSMRTGKPAVDGTILHSEWDNVGGFSHQVFFANSSNADANNRMQWRAMDSGTWGEWKSVAFIDTGMLKPTQGLQINHIGSNYAEGIRLANRNGTSNTWSEINFGCDPSATTGTHATQWTVGRNGNNNYFVIRNNATDRIQIDLSGNTTLTGNFVATGGVTAQNSSDKRLKRNIRKFNARKVLMSLGGVYQYEYVDSEVAKNHIYKGTHYGLIFQHVKGTTLDVMCHEREDGFGTLNYIHPKFISLIAGATMENISEVEKLKRKIRTLEAKVKQLENRV